jgi:glycosyl transferase, family 25
MFSIAVKPVEGLSRQLPEMNLFDVFERIVVINLPERRDRRKHVLAELAKVGVSEEDRRVQVFAAIRPADPGGFPSIGSRGCFMSHLTVIEEALRDGIQRLLIVEDDLKLESSIFQPLPMLAGQLVEGDWDFAYLGHVEALPGDPESPNWLITTAPVHCTHFYGLNRRVMSTLYEYLQSCLTRPAGSDDGGPMHVDGAYSMFRARETVKTLIAVPSLGGQRSSRSDIYPNRWYDRTPVLKELAGWAREIRLIR